MLGFVLVDCPDRSRAPSWLPLESVTVEVFASVDTVMFIIDVVWECGCFNCLPPLTPVAECKDDDELLALVGPGGVQPESPT